MGQLFPIEDYKTFGCYFNTHHKTILVCDGSAAAEFSGVKEAISTLNASFIEAIQNPFQATGTPLVSKRLDDMVQLIVNKYNAALPKRK